MAAPALHKRPAADTSSSFPAPVSRLASTIRTAVGTLTALAAIELGLRLFVSPNAPPTPDIPHDALFAPSVTTRQFDEGLGVARFTVTGARITGNTPLDDASTIVLLGDSFVAAREVDDSVTAGSRLERMARAAGLRVNVRQYGWRGASPPQYLVAARAIRARWDPARVVVLLSNDDLDDHVLAGQYPRMRVARNGSVLLVAGPSPTQPQPRSIVRRSALALVLWRRWNEIADRAPGSIRAMLGRQPNGWNPQNSRELAILPRAVVRALAHAYGSELALVYVADVRVTGGDAPDPLEARLLDACAAFHVRCSSTRDAMLAARREGGIARGFSTTTLGVGHLNATGHAIVASTIWSLIATPMHTRTASLTDVQPQER